MPIPDTPISNCSHPRRALLTCASVLLVAVAASCQQPGYRTEVVTAEQGRTEVHQVPLAPPSAANPTPGPAHVAVTGSEPGPNSAPAPAVSSDPDLAAVQSFWPRLTPEDRKRVADMARRLAPPQ